MAWSGDYVHWDCEVCEQTVDPRGVFPWCPVYCTARNALCRPTVKESLRIADANGDGPMVNALCAYGRKRWGPDIDW